VELLLVRRNAHSKVKHTSQFRGPGTLPSGLVGQIGRSALTGSGDLAYRLHTVGSWYALVEKASNTRASRAAAVHLQES
jgi:hypothetical protein